MYMFTCMYNYVHRTKLEHVTGSKSRMDHNKKKLKTMLRHIDDRVYKCDIMVHVHVFLPFSTSLGTYV